MKWIAWYFSFSFRHFKDEKKVKKKLDAYNGIWHFLCDQIGFDGSLLFLEYWNKCINGPHAIRTFFYACELIDSSDVDRSLSIHFFLLYLNLKFSISWLGTGTHREYVNIWFEHFSIVLIPENNIKFYDPTDDYTLVLFFCIPYDECS